MCSHGGGHECAFHAWLPTFATITTCRWAYSPERRRCVTFWYGGCHPNANNFATKRECNEACRWVDVLCGDSPCLPRPAVGQQWAGHRWRLRGAPSLLLCHGA